MKVCDIIANFIIHKKIETIFGIIGSANAPLFDSITNHNFTKIVSLHHEQAVVMAMGGYYRASKKLSISIVTAGAGASNTITGVLSNWADSIPGIIISGQEKTEYLKHNTSRMYGTQGFNIVKMVQGITKFSVTVMDYIIFFF